MTKIKSTNKPKIAVILGPTASGKSALGIKLAKKFGGEIISADSRQVYMGMDIGTGKITKKERKIVPHHLLDIASPKKQFTADDFRKAGQKTINSIISKNKIPVIVGGTGFYIDVLLERMPVTEVPPNKKLRARFDKLTVEHLFKMLQKLDPECAKNIDGKNKRRLIRALEIISATGKKPITKTYNLKPETYNILWIGINPGRNELADKIKKRLDLRLKQGMIGEVKKLHQKGVAWKRFYDFGLEYRQISLYLRDKKMQDKKFKDTPYYEKLLREIIKYSKRQMTWFKRNKEINWINSSVAGQKKAEKLFVQFVR